MGVRFKSAGKIYDFNAGPFVLNTGDQVIVETENGLCIGSVCTPPEEVEVETDENDLPVETRTLEKVYRPAGEKDLEQVFQNRETEKKAHDFCLSQIRDLGLRMNLFSVESNFEASKLTFFFTADGRVDFRQLVKNLVKEYRIRIEMRQVGIRNQAKMCGGLGRCGRELCCATFLEKFEPVSIRMAKEQGLSLNPTKISGQCGRLMCCLTFEHETYKRIKSENMEEGWPKIGKTYTTKNGEKARVIRHNIIAGKIAVRMESGQETEVKPDDIS